MKMPFNRAAAVALMLGIGLLGSVMYADDNAPREEQLRFRRVRVLDPVASKYWIGVHAVPIDESLKSQLNLGERLIVRTVMPNSPAATAGLKRHDILFKFGDRDVRNLDDLLEAVSANELNATNVVVLRGGKEKTLDIQPTERPADIEAHLPEDLSFWKPLEGWLGGEAGRLRIVGPGVFEELPELPGNLSITVTKQNNEPAKITVKRNEDTWEITEDEIGELPENLREHVRRHLDGPHGIRPGARRIRRSGVEDGEILITPRSLVPEGADVRIREQMERALQQLEKLQQRWSDDSPLKALQDEVKSLRREVEQLRQRDQRPDPPANEARDT